MKKVKCIPNVTRIDIAFRHASSTGERGDRPAVAAAETADAVFEFRTARSSESADPLAKKKKKKEKGKKKNFQFLPSRQVAGWCIAYS